MTRHPEAPAPDRRQHRRRMLFWSACPVLLVLCLAAKLLSVGVLAGVADRSFADGKAGAVADAAQGLRIANLIEPHKAPFAEGDGLFLAGNFAAARERFEEALSVAGAADECVIRVNLVLSIERLGDAQARAEDPTAAGRLFAEGLAVVEDAPEGCFGTGAETGSDSGAESGTGEKLEQARARLQQKAEAAADNGAPQPPEQPAEKNLPAGPVQQSQLEQLKDGAREAQRERNSGREREEYLGDAEFGAGAEKPW